MRTRRKRPPLWSRDLGGSARLRESMGGAVCGRGPPLGGELVASGRIPIQSILAALDAVEETA